MAISNNIIGQYEANLKAQTTTDRVATDKDTFLKLLVAQLTHQDPLNPVEDKEFIAQLAQFTTVEELQNINKGVEDLNSAYLDQQTVNAASLINTLVVAGGDNVYLRDADKFAGPEDYPSIYFDLPRDSAGGTMSVFSTNSDGSVGNMVYSTTMGAFRAGRNVAQWDGRGFAGETLANGTYVVNITAKDADGDDIYVTTMSGGLVVGVETSSDGNHKLYLEDGRTAYFKEIALVLGVYGSGSDSGSGSGEEGETENQTPADPADPADPANP